MQPPKQENIITDMLVEEQAYHYIPGFWDQYANDFRTKKVDILGWLQTEKYWQHCKPKVHAALAFKESFYNKIRNKYSKYFEKPTIAVSIRRGDFVTNPNFYLLPIEYYLGALKTFFPGYKDQHVIFFSDDLDYCRHSIKGNRQFYFATGLNAIEQLCLMSMCDDFIISNSTFSWWGAMLGEKKHSKIIRPAFFLDGELMKKFDWKDHYPERWTVYDHTVDPPNIQSLLNSKLEAGIINKKIRSIQSVKKLVRKVKGRVKIKTSK